MADHLVTPAKAIDLSSSLTDESDERRRGERRGEERRLTKGEERGTKEASRVSALLIENCPSRAR